MGKENEILAFLSQGINPKEIIEKGYKKSTVYKINQIHTGRRKMKMSVEVKYIITALLLKTSHVLLTLEPLSDLPSPEEIERARIESELEVDNKSDDFVEKVLEKIDFRDKPKNEAEKIMREVSDAMRKEIPEMFNEQYKPKTTFVAQYMTIVPPMELFISKEQYRDLGSPSLLQVITLTIRVTQ